MITPYMDHIASLQAENADLREALEFYAKVDNYEIWENADTENLTSYVNNVDFDGGYRAARVLEANRDDRF